MKKLQQLFLVLVVIAASWQITSAAYIHVKAFVAQKLLLDAWNKTLDGGKKVKPWSWADTWPVARLQVPAHEQDLIILAGDSGRNLAFAPGYRFGTAKPGAQGISMISAHRDTHFKFLKNVQVGDEIKIITEKKEFVTYGITKIKIVNQKQGKIELEQTDKRLVLVTCYPFDDVFENTDLRYLVFAKQIKTNQLRDNLGV